MLRLDLLRLLWHSSRLVRALGLPTSSLQSRSSTNTDTSGRPLARHQRAAAKDRLEYPCFEYVVRLPLLLLLLDFHHLKPRFCFFLLLLRYCSQIRNRLND